jgi:hypothetical protein
MTSNTITYSQLRRGDWDVLGSAGMTVHLEPQASAATLQATWLLNDEGLNVDLHVANRSRERTPFNVSVAVQLRPVGEQVQVLVPAEEVIVDGTTIPVSGRFDLRRPQTVDQPLVARFTRRHFANLRTSAAVLATAEQREVWFVNIADFRNLQVRLDTHGAGQLEAETGERILAPSEDWSGSTLLATRVLDP